MRLRRITLSILAFASFFFGLANFADDAKAQTCEDVRKLLIAEALSSGDVYTAVKAQSMCKGPCEVIRQTYIRLPLTAIPKSSPAYPLISSKLLKAYTTCVKNSYIAPPKGGGSYINKSQPCWYMKYLGTGYVNLNSDLNNTSCLSNQKNLAIKLSRVSLSKVSIRNSDFRAADLSNATLIESSLRGTNFSNADFTNARLENVDLTGTNLRNAKLDGLRAIKIVGKPSALPKGWTVQNGILLGPSADLAEVNLSDMNLAGLDLSGANLSYANLNDSTVSNLRLKDAQLFGLEASNLKGRTSILPAGFVFVGKAIIGAGQDLSGRDFSNIDLSGVDLTSSNLHGVRLDGAKMKLATLHRVRSGSVSGTPSSLPQGWKMVSGHIVGPTADLRNSEFRKVSLKGLNLSGALLDGIQSSELSSGPATLPKNWQYRSGFILGPNANLRLANLRNLDLSKVDFSYANFEKADVSGSSFDNSLLTYANLKGIKSGYISKKPKSLPNNWGFAKGYLIGAEVDLSEVDLSGTQINGVDIDGAILRDTNLDDSKWVGISGEIEPGSAFRVTKGILVGAGMDLSNLDLKWANLANMNITSADFTDSDLSFANLSNTDISGSIIEGAKLGYIIDSYAKGISWANHTLVDRIRGLDLIGQFADGNEVGEINPSPRAANVVNGNLLVSGGDVSGANLNDANLSGLVLTNVDFRDAELKNSVFQNTDISGANLSGADFSDSDLTNLQSRDVEAIGTILPSGYRALRGYIFGPRVKIDVVLDGWSNLDLSATDLSGASLNGNFTFANFSGTNLSAANLIGADLRNANFFATNLTNAVLPLPSERLAGIRSGQITHVSDSSLLFAGQRQATWTLQGGFLLGPGANLSLANLRNLNLGCSTNLSGANLSGAALWNMTIGADLSSANLSEADARGTRFVKCANGGLYSANLTDTKLQGADLFDTSLRFANLAGADITGANMPNDRIKMYRLRSGGIKGTEGALLSRGLDSDYKLINGYIVGMGVDLSEQNLAGLNLGSVNLDGASFRNANLSNCIFSNALLSYTDFRNANLSSADLLGAELYLAQVQDADLQGAYWNYRYSVVGTPKNIDLRLINNGEPR